MDKWIKENKIAAVIIIVLVVVLGIVYFDKQPKKIGSTDEVKPVEERVSFGEKVLSFDALDKVEKFEDLAKYGLVAPEQYNHTSGKNLVLLAIKANSFFKGDWAAAHGLLGVNMLDVDELDRVGYKSLFTSLFVTQGFKMYADSVMDDLALLAEPDGSVKQTKSIIARREGAIYSVSNQIEARYIYNNEGNYGRNYFPEPNRKSNGELKAALLSGLKVYNELLTAGFDDKTLKDSLCMAYASLYYDGVSVGGTDIYKLGSLQVCTDALKATLTKLNSKKDHSSNFLYELGWEMQSRNLASDDKILLPEDDKNYEAMLKVFENDLAAIKK